MLPKIGNYLLIILLGTLPLSAQIIIEESREISLPDNILNDKANLEINLRAHYAELGYFDIRMDTLESGGTIKIEKGCRFTVENFTYSDDTKTAVEQKFNYSGFYSGKMIEGTIESERDRYINEGYLKANAEITKFEPNKEECLVDIHVNFEKGSIYTVDALHLSGNSQNSDRFLTRISGFESSIAATKNNLERIRQNLLQSELFNSVSGAELFENDNNIILAYKVEERNLNTLDGVIGLANNSVGKSILVGTATATMGNLFTEGNQIELHYDRISTNTSRLKLKAGQNFIANTPFGANIGFSIFQNDTTYQTRKWELGGDYRVATGLRLNFGLRANTSVSSLSDGTEMEPDGKTLGFSVGFIYRTLNYFDVPTAGFLLNMDLFVANKSFDDYDIKNQKIQALHGYLEHYYPLTARFIVLNTINGYMAQAKLFTIEDLLRFGGANSIRGYNEEQLLASKVAWTDLEFRYLLNPTSYLLVFGSAGRYHRPKLFNESDNSFKITENLYSVGAGLSYRTAIGRLSFVYALSPSANLSNGKVHFGIKTSL